jgi:hypothetical protein
VSATSDDARSREEAPFTDRFPAVVGGVGLASLTAGAVLIEGWLPVGIVLVTALVWWRTTTPLALTVLTIGLTVIIPPVFPAIQFGGSMAMISTLDVPLILFASGMGLLTIGSWVASGTVPLLAGGWMLLPLGVGWLFVGAAVAAALPLWLVVVSCGGLTLLGANAITQLTDYRLTTTEETAATVHRDQ